MDILLYLSTTVFFGLYVFKIFKQNNINAFSIFLFLIFFVYLVIPTLVFILGSDYQDKYPIIGNIFSSNVSERLKSLIYIFMFTLSAIIFYRITPISSNQNFNYTKYIKSKIYNKAKIIGFLMLSIGLLGFFYMTYNLGGVSSLLKFSGSFRGEGSYEFVAGSMLSYAVILSRALLGAVYPLILIYELKKKKSVILLILFSLIVGTVYLIFNAGKLQVIIYFIPLFLYLANKIGNMRNKIIFYMGIALIIFWLIPKMDSLFYYMTHGIFLSSFKDDWDFMDNIMGLIGSFTYPFSNLIIADNMNELYGMRFGLDFIVPFINIFPNKVLATFGISEITTLYKYTSVYYQSFVPGFLETAGVPNDIISLAFRQFSYPSLILVGGILGVLMKHLDNAILTLKKLGREFENLLYTNTMVIIPMLFLEPYSALTAYYHIFISLVLTFYIHRLLKINKKK